MPVFDLLFLYSPDCYVVVNEMSLSLASIVNCRIACVEFVGVLHIHFRDTSYDKLIKLNQDTLSKPASDFLVISACHFFGLTRFGGGFGFFTVGGRGLRFLLRSSSTALASSSLLAADCSGTSISSSSSS